jgi:hypothetical protein
MFGQFFAWRVNQLAGFGSEGAAFAVPTES